MKHPTTDQLNSSDHNFDAMYHCLSLDKLKLKLQ